MLYGREEMATFSRVASLLNFCETEKDFIRAKCSEKERMEAAQEAKLHCANWLPILLLGKMARERKEITPLDIVEFLEEGERKYKWKL